MMNLLGLRHEEALRRLREAGIEPQVLYTAAPGGQAEGAYRVVRVREEGRELTAACFADQAGSREE